MPVEVHAYLLHIYCGQTVRAIGAAHSVHASTISRQIRKCEMRRDEPLVDAGLEQLAQVYFPTPPLKEQTPMKTCDTLSDENISREARRILRRLCEHDTFLLVSAKMDKGAVFKEVVPGRQTRLAVTPREVAEAFALKDWIAGENVGAVSRYSITPAGRKALKRMLIADRAAKDSATTPFQDQHKEFGERLVKTYDGSGRKACVIIWPKAR